MIYIPFLAKTSYLNKINKTQYRRYDEQKITSHFLCTGAS